ncbi:MAG TPA: alanine--tRNA ligase [Armatimonadetes bacterium]|nr:alanine--tRNA ligase [Armatimonadota bacterium]
MKSGDDLRQEFLEFFKEKGHHIGEGISLIPPDPSLLLTVAGVVPFRDFIEGVRAPEHRRVATCQRCVRVADIDEVGRTRRHLTFFEMLGNFSFGDYYKREAILWAWEFVTERMKIPQERLWVTIYEEDDESHRIWAEEVGFPEERIIRLGMEDNFWGPAGKTGACGPCTEIHYDFGPDKACGPDCKPGCDCDRFLELWNLVFTELYKDEEGNLHPLPQKNIDTGMGLERLAAIIQGADSAFECDLLRPILERAEEIVRELAAEEPSLPEGERRVALRVIADHARAITFMIADGILPSNEGRGYVLRRLIRRTITHAHKLGVRRPFLKGLIPAVIDRMRVGYPYLSERAPHILRAVELEERRFRETLDQGMRLLKQAISKAREEGLRSLPGKEAFRLYDTYGFPLELTEEIASLEGLSVDREGFEREMERQRERARSAMAEMGVDEVYQEVYRRASETQFVGYETLEAEAEVVAIVKGGVEVEEAREGEEVEVVLSQTPFYGEMGGQVGDTGEIVWEGGRMTVRDAKRPIPALISHVGRVVEGALRKGQPVLARVDEGRRREIMKHHTGTHLLQAALRKVLGEHVTQQGSLVAPDRLRFDFSHYEALSPQQIEEVERLVNEAIQRDMEVEVFWTSFEESQRMGALTVPGEKYGEQVRVVKVGDFSLELCGGTHVRRTGEIGAFLIVDESSVGANIRRVEALCGMTALRFLQGLRRQVWRARALLKARTEEVADRVERLLLEREELKKELERVKRERALERARELVGEALEVEGVKVVAKRVEGLDREGLLALAEEVLSMLKPGVVVLGTAEGGRAVLVARATREAVSKGVHCGRALKEAASFVKGGGGGKPESAQAGGKDPSGLDEALRAVLEALKAQLRE